MGTVSSRNKKKSPKLAWRQKRIRFGLALNSLTQKTRRSLYVAGWILLIVALTVPTLFEHSLQPSGIAIKASLIGLAAVAGLAANIYCSYAYETAKKQLAIKSQLAPNWKNADPLRSAFYSAVALCLRSHADKRCDFGRSDYELHTDLHTIAQRIHDAFDEKLSRVNNLHLTEVQRSDILDSVLSGRNILSSSAARKLLRTAAAEPPSILSRIDDSELAIAASHVHKCVSTAFRGSLVNDFVHDGKASMAFFLDVLSRLTFLGETNTDKVQSRKYLEASANHAVLASKAKDFAIDNESVVDNYYRLTMSRCDNMLVSLGKNLASIDEKLDRIDWRTLEIKHSVDRVEANVSELLYKKRAEEMAQASIRRLLKIALKTTLWVISLSWLFIGFTELGNKNSPLGASVMTIVASTTVMAALILRALHNARKKHKYLTPPDHIQSNPDIS